MKQKMVIKMSVNCEKCRKKAMRVAAVADGVMSVALEGDFKDKLMVVGDGVDAACLVAALRKTACYATLETLEEVKPQGNDDDNAQKGGNGGDKPKNGGNGGDKPKNGGNGGGEPKNGGNGGDKPKNGGNGNQKKEEPPPCASPQCPYICYQQPPSDMYRVVYDSYGPTTGCTIM